VYAFPAALALWCNAFGDFVAVVVGLVKGEDMVFLVCCVGFLRDRGTCGALQFDILARLEIRRFATSLEEARHRG